MKPCDPCERSTFTRATEQTCEAALSLGSNLGDRLTWLNEACAALERVPGVTLLARSPIYETEPVGVPADVAGQLYLNCVVIIATALTPPALSAAIHAIEDRLGRTRGSAPNLPRTIDIDVVTLGNLRSDDPLLLLPHPRASERRFVLQPLADVRPDLVLPGDTQSVSERLRALPPSPRVTRWRPQVSEKNVPS